MNKDFFGNIIRKTANVLSASTSIIAVLATYYIGVEKSRSIQGFLLGIALWIISLLLTSISRELNNSHNSKDSAIKLKFVYLINCISLAWILPHVVLLPFLGTCMWNVGDPTNFIGVYTWLYYSLIFTCLVIVVFILYLLIDLLNHRKKNNLK